MRSTNETTAKDRKETLPQPAAATQPAVSKWQELGISKNDMLEMYYQLVLARTLDERIWLLNRQGKTAFVISCAGQEATQVGFAKALKPGYDVVWPYYRSLALALSMGMTPTEVMLHQLSKAEDPSSGGRQMPAHFGLARLNMVSVSSPVATQLTQATGSGYASKLKGDDKVTYTFVGDGGTSKGDFHEALNFAAIHSLPVVFVVENNGYAISVPISKQMHIANIADRATAYGMPGVVVDGNDLLEVYRVACDATDRARRGDGPTLVEAKTYRYRPHSSSDDDRAYRTKEEVEEWRLKDPIIGFERYLEEHGLITKEGEQAVRNRAKQAVEEAQRYAEAAPNPSPDTIMRYVYAEEGQN
ncbi:MAG: 2-oxoisovalerate dehydrogenase subunit alpha [Chloroflexi bacterium]|jgi:2-oxoisovalerate dehydrogenase E1 component alpha subunit|nr:2-oxoisovalerate dehydrogenase subunit alpha [Chloroflexota bacterium]